jgi:FkbM family methyltransferase
VESQRQIGEVLACLNAQNLSLAETQTAALQASIHVVESQRQIGEVLAYLNAQNLSLAETQTAALQTSIHVLESQRQIGEGLACNLESQRQIGEGLARNLETQRQIREGFACNLESQRQISEGLASNLESQRQISEVLAHHVSVETSDYEFTNPETGLMDLLYSYLPTRKAIDVGAHTGDVSECLLRSGYEVYAFEPFPPVYEKLVSRLGGQEGFHSFNFALGCDEAEMPLHLAQDLSGSRKYGDVTVFSSLAAHSMPDDLPFTSSSTVMVKNLANLHREGVIPADIGLVKIDTEGFDLEVIRGMGDFRYPVVCAEFWDAKIPFGQSGVPYTLDSLVREVKKLGYVWHIVLYRIWGRNVTAFYGNHHRSVPESWGNVFFFRDFGLFSQGQAWCSAVLPRTYFRSVPAKQTRAGRQTSPASATVRRPSRAR